MTSKNLKVDKGVIRTSESSFDENGREEYVTDNDSRATVKVGANEISQTLDDKGDNPEKAASRVLSQNTNNKYEITDSVVEGNQSNVENRTAASTDSEICCKDDSGKVLNKSYITQNLKKVLMGVEEGDNKTTIEQDANNITNTAKNGTIKMMQVNLSIQPAAPLLIWLEMTLPTPQPMAILLILQPMARFLIMPRI